MNFLDIVLGILLVWGLYKGLKNGLFVELASLIALVAGIFGAIHFSYIASDYLSQNMELSERFLKVTAFLLTFVAIIILVGLAGKLLTKIADFAMLGILNKIAGGIFGALKVAVILGAALIFFESATASLNFINKDTQDESVLYRPVRDIGAFIFSEVFKEESSTIEE
jgi:membrane protein required for colicin V production